MTSASKDYTAERLLRFEQQIADEFETGAIRAPIHLGGGNEAQLIDYFNTSVQDWDWVLCSWRSHYHCLLKGVPPDVLRAAIRAGRSVSLCFPDQRILSSGIVGGTAPIALGLAWPGNYTAPTPTPIRVHCFIGDMTEKAGIVREAMEYGARHGLSIVWIVEDNGLSVCTPTDVSWGLGKTPVNRLSYKYELSRPHAGTGRWVDFSRGSASKTGF